MPILPTETPAKENTPDPKANGSAAASSSQSSSTEGSAADPSNSSAANTSADGTATSTVPAKTTPTKAQQDFEAKLEQLATLDLSVKQQAREVAKAKAQLDRYRPIDEHLTKGEIKAAARKFFGERYTADLLLELADDFAPEEVSVEDRVKRTLEAERKAAEDAATKRAEEQAGADKAAVDTETKNYLVATADHLRTNKGKYPLICAWDDDPDVNHEGMIDKIWRDHYAKTGEVLEPDKVLAQVEARHLARIQKTSFAPRVERELSLEEHAGNSPPVETQRPLAPPPLAKPLTGADEARARLEAYDRDQEQRARLSYGR
jgi:hypothetical protein